MDKQYVPKEHEERLYAFWEKNGFTQAPTKGKPYTILMPPPNANASLHAGHGMYVIDDILTRYKRLQGFSSVWIPGMDHAGFETQYVYEKHLAKQKKSRMDFDRKTLYDNIHTFVQENSGLIYQQFKKLGFLADWERSVFTLDDHVLARVFETFTRMEKENLVYRDDYIVNYCTHCGTSLAELEVKHVDRIDPLYYVRYLYPDKKEYIVVATVRPETIFVDTHLAVNPKDKKNKHLIGKKVLNPLTNKQMVILADSFVDPEFGTGIVKLTPAHDVNDFNAAKTHALPIIKAFDLRGKATECSGKYAGMKVRPAREAIAKDLMAQGIIEKVNAEYSHAVSVCYKCARDLEPTVIPNWFIRVKDLKQKAAQAVKENKVEFFPKKYKKQILAWYAKMHDWPISRQIAWGIRIPVWYRVEKDADNIFVTWLDDQKRFMQGTVDSFLKKGITIETIEKGLQTVNAEIGERAPTYVVSSDKPHDGHEYLPETDTLDTWFSSGQWPLVTLEESEYATRFPTNMLGTLSDILPFWVSRMIMFSLYIRGTVPFHHVYLWSMVADAKGMKMSKSKGNVVNPIELVDKYGADAFRASLLFGVSQGGKVILAEDKVRAMRNFANKIWNMGRFISLSKSEKVKMKSEKLNSKDQKIVGKLRKEIENLRIKYHKYMDEYKLSRAFDELYEFAWHRLADVYIEALKESLKNGTIEAQTELEVAYRDTLKMLHPFIPFVTEAVYQEFYGKNTSIISSKNI
ncbi:MAG: valine--tRNA ligase [Candidatus Roizmanbacteria bacterium]|nr:valine--tRNA ligase [Candidatus Roizmanbacteria bacterium]